MAFILQVDSTPCLPVRMSTTLRAKDKDESLGSCWEIKSNKLPTFTSLVAMDLTLRAKVIWIFKTISMTGVSESRHDMDAAAPQERRARMFVLGIRLIPASSAYPATCAFVQDLVL